MINLNNCEFDGCISLDENDCFDDSKNGEFGYRVFYNVPLESVTKSGYFTEDQMLGDDYAVCGGQIEFTVDGDGKQVGEVLLWLSVEDLEEGDVGNTDFVNYNEDISEIVDDFVSKHMDKDKEM